MTETNSSIKDAVKERYAQAAQQVAAGKSAISCCRATESMLMSLLRRLTANS